LISPASSPIRASGDNAWFGWPTDKKLEELREAWFNTTDPAAARKAADAVQLQAFKFVPYIPTAQFIIPTAYRSNLSGLIVAPMVFLWNVEKK
jgi:peptide/nickel transport system substrate-binding protein